MAHSLFSNQASRGQLLPIPGATINHGQHSCFPVAGDRKSFTERDADPEERSGIGSMDGISFPLFRGLPEGLGRSGNGGGVGISRGFNIPKKAHSKVKSSCLFSGKNTLGKVGMAAGASRDWENPGKQHRVPKIPGFVPIPGKKDNISTFPSVSPLFWDGGGPENPMEPPPEFVQEKQAPGNSSSQNPPPKILGNDPELLFASRNPSQ